MPTTIQVERAADALSHVCTERKIPGAALGVVANGEVIVKSVIGTANVGTGLAVTDDTIFQAGSIGKSYTATVVLQLVDEGLLDLDRPVKDYISDLELSDSQAAKSITPRHLLSHTAGIEGDRFDDEGIYGRGDDCFAKYVTDLKSLPMVTEPGGLWSYCNSGYILLGRLIEVLTETTYERVVQERLLDPLGLKKTFFFPGEIIMHSVAVGHMPQPDGEPVVSPLWEFPRVTHPAGGNLSTTIEELLAFAQLHLSGGIAPDGTRILSAESVRAMRRPHAACPERELLGDRWGLGWFLRTEASPLVVGHDGNTVGQTSGLRLIPEHNTAYAVLTNLHGQNDAFQELAQELIDPWLATTTVRKPTPASDTTVPDPERFVGVYAKVGGRLLVTLDGNQLHGAIEPSGEQSEELQIDPKPRLLKPVDDTRFLLPIEELGDDVLITFLEPDQSHRPRFLHMGARLWPRVG